MADRQVVGAGNKYGFGGFIDSDGILIGSTPTAPTTGSATNGEMFRVLGIKRAVPTVPEPTTTIVTWDDDAMEEFQFNSIATRRFLIDVAIQDLTTWARLVDESVQAAFSSNSIELDRVSAPEYDTTWFFQSRARQEVVTNQGAKAWQATQVLSASALILGRVQYNEREGAVFRLSVTPHLASHQPTGLTLFDVNNAQMSARYRMYDLDYPVTMHRSTGTLTVIPVKYQPYDAAHAQAVTERVNNPIASVSTAGKTITLTNTPSGSGARTVTIYQFSGE